MMCSFENVNKFQVEQANMCCGYFNSYLYFNFLQKKEEVKPPLLLCLHFSKKFVIPNYDRAKRNESLFPEVILPVNSAWALLPHRIAFGLSDEHDK